MQVNAQDSSGHTPLQVALVRGHTHVARLLREYDVEEDTEPQVRRVEHRMLRHASRCRHTPRQAEDAG